MNVRSVFQRKTSSRVAAAALVACLLSPGVAAAQDPAAKHGERIRAAKVVGPAADRMVAEWMLRMGGSIVLEGQRKPITDLADLPTTDFRIHTLNFTGITMYAASLQDELRRLPALPHLKELYVNGRLWYDQPAPRVQATIALFNEATALEKFVMSKPVQTYIPFNDPALKGLSSLTEPERGAHSPDAQLGDVAGRVSAHASRSELRGDVQRHRHGEPEGQDDAAARCICAARRLPMRASRICPV